MSYFYIANRITSQPPVDNAKKFFPGSEDLKLLWGYQSWCLKPLFIINGVGIICLWQLKVNKLLRDVLIQVLCGNIKFDQFRPVGRKNGHMSTSYYDQWAVAVRPTPNTSKPAKFMTTQYLISSYDPEIHYS